MFRRKHIPALIIAVTIVLLYIPWIIPPSANTFIWHRFLLGVSLIITGGVTVLALFTSSMPIERFSPLWVPDNAPVSDYFVSIGITTLALIVLALITGYAIQQLWTRFRSSVKWLVRVAVVLVVSGNSLFGMFYCYLNGILVEMISCERFVSPDDGILIEVYGEIRPDDDSMDHAFILVTHDGGQSWQHSWYESGSDFDGDPLCRHLNERNAQLLWTWDVSSIYVSPDSGDQWYYYETTDPVERVEFTDISHGTAWLGASGDVILATSDGGQSWHPLASPDAPAITTARW